MRLKRVAFAGTLVLVIICTCLFLLLDRTFTDYRMIKSDPLFPSQKAGPHTPSGDSFYRTPNSLFQGNNDFLLDQNTCSAHPSPQVDVQMGKVYDELKFDNPDGGAWKQGWKVTYNENQWSQSNKLKIFVVPHSHNDPGWKKTFEGYYISQTRSILNNMVVKLMEDQRRKFIWAEISFFALWWSEISDQTKEKVKLLISRGQLEMVTGGWVMTDEANSHYYAIIQELIAGHQWLLDNLGYIPKHSWSIDPFGLSPSLPYILKKAGFEALVVQRSHYSVKKYLALKKQLEFQWRQLWDNEGSTELFTHMMPFYSYDVPHTCGPDPKVCCQFDFMRLPGFLTCPWKVQPQPITEKNVAHRAKILLNQYRKKAQLYSTNVVLIPLGDDFRYDREVEWDIQYNNYQKLFDYINNASDLYAEAQFGTLRDYFEAVKSEKPEKDFPTLSGDFFTYADRDDHYWSGYYTSRPFHKRMDRVLVANLRSAELLLSMVINKNKGVDAWKKLMKEVNIARENLALFQHHDGITGTAKDEVVKDYAQKMLTAIQKSQHVIQQCTYYLLSQGKDIPAGDEVFFLLDEQQKMVFSLPEQKVLTFPSGIEARHVTFFNPLSSPRVEVVSLKVENPMIEVLTSQHEVIPHQISPLCTMTDDSMKCYQISFVIHVEPLGFVTYSLKPADDNKDSHVFLKLFNVDHGSFQFEYWENKQIQKGGGAFSIQNNNYSISFTETGMMKSVSLKLKDTVVTLPIHLSFVKYSARMGNERSGAYLFLPDGLGRTLYVAHPRIIVVEGKVFSQVIVHLPTVVHSVLLYHEGYGHHGIEIQNLVNIASVNDNYELAMRFSSDVKNGNVFYTDLNGIQMIKRKTLSKIPLQGNFYPMPGMVFIEDSKLRLTVVSAQPLGVASLNEGQVEIMQDRRLLQDDNRGLGQGVMDNKPTLALFRLLPELRSHDCQEVSVFDRSPYGLLSESSLVSYNQLLYPVHKLIWEGDPRVTPASLSFKHSPALPSRAHIVSAVPLKDFSTGIILQTSKVDRCFYHSHDKKEVNISSLVPTYSGKKVYHSSITFNKLGDELLSSTIPLCDINLSTFVISH